MKKYISLEDIYYKPGDVIQMHWQGGGFITTSGTSLRFTLPTDKPVNAKSVKLSGNLTVRYNNHYIYGDAQENTSIDNLRQNCQYITPCGLSFSLANDNGFFDENGTKIPTNVVVGVLFLGTVEFT